MCKKILGGLNTRGLTNQITHILNLIKNNNLFEGEQVTQKTYDYINQGNYIEEVTS